MESLELTERDIKHLAKVFDLLAQWDFEDRQEEKNSNSPDISEPSEISGGIETLAPGSNKEERG